MRPGIVRSTLLRWLPHQFQVHDLMLGTSVRVSAKPQKAMHMKQMGKDTIKPRAALAPWRTAVPIQSLPVSPPQCAKAPAQSVFRVSSACKHLSTNPRFAQSCEIWPPMTITFLSLASNVFGSMPRLASDTERISTRISRNVRKRYTALPSNHLQCRLPFFFAPHHRRHLLLTSPPSNKACTSCIPETCA